MTTIKLNRNRNLRYCDKCCKVFTDRTQNLNNVNDKIDYFTKLLKRLSFDVLDLSYLPERKSNLERMFYEQNNGLGFTEEERSNILKLFKLYLKFLNTIEDNLRIKNYKLILYYILSIYPCKRFNINSKHRLSHWDEFYQSLLRNLEVRVSPEPKNKRSVVPALGSPVPTREEEQMALFLD
jgi:hypothetical protein